MTMEKYIEKAAVLIEALPYIQSFRGAIVVIKFGGSAMENPECVENTLRDIVFMECVGMKPVIVHGGGKNISAKLIEIGIEPRFINGLRHTCEKTISVVDQVLHYEVNPHLVNALVKFGGRAQGVSGKQILLAEKISSTHLETGELMDLGFVGDVAAVDIQKIKAILDNEEVPVITPVGADKDNLPYNINADIAASRIAEALQARKLVYLSDVPGILADPKDEKSLISTIRVSELDQLIKTKVITGGMLPKIHSAAATLQTGVNKVHFIDGRLQHSLLLEIFTHEGVGTQIIKD